MSFLRVSVSLATVVALLILMVTIMKGETSIPTDKTQTKSASSHHSFTGIVRPGDRTYIEVTHACGECSPVVIEKYKLIFFTIPKVGCTAWKLVLRRMMGYDNYYVTGQLGLPHSKQNNGLKFLYDYDLVTANEIMTSPEWTRAIFVRDPKARLLSAYLDKVEGPHGRAAASAVRCCKDLPEEDCTTRSQGFENFVHFLLPRCINDHWRPQNVQMPTRYWEQINFVGHIETLEEDSRRLLEKIGAWEEHGANGWGKAFNESLFHQNAVPKHTTGANDHMREYYTPELERLAEEFYAEDYNSKYMNLTLEKFYPSS